MRRVCARSYYARRFSDSDREDFVSAVVERYYSLPEFERPPNEEAFEIFSIETIRSLAQKLKSLHKAEVSQEGVAMTHQDGNSDPNESPLEMMLSRYGSVGHLQRPRQEDYMHCLDVLRVVGKTGYQADITKLFDCGSVVEFAKDTGLSLFDAMNEQARIRMIVKRLMEDEADEKKFGGENYP